MDLDKSTQQTDENPEEELSNDEFLELLEESFDYKPPHRGEIRKAIILQIERNEIIVDMGAKQDGIVTSKDLEHLDAEFRESLQVDQEVPVFVLQPRDSDGNLIVSINMGLQQYDWEKAAELLENEDVVPVKVTGYNRGGVLVRWNRLEGFIPSSHMVTVSPSLQGGERKDALDALTRPDAEKLRVKVIEVNPERRRLIFSEREAQREWRAKRKAELLDALAEGDTVKGVVTGLRDFGAFVNLGGADGLIHVSELAWHRVDHPRDILTVGDEIDVFILNLDRETNRIALSLKRIKNDPWENAIEQYYEGQLVEGTVTNVVDFGAFIALDDGLEGLLHLSEMGDGALKEPYSYVKKGDRLQLRISRLEPERRRVGFTQRWGTELPQADDATDTDTATPDQSTDIPDIVEMDVAEASVVETADVIETPEDGEAVTTESSIEEIETVTEDDDVEDTEDNNEADDDTTKTDAS